MELKLVHVLLQDGPDCRNPASALLHGRVAVRIQLFYQLWRRRAPSVQARGQGLKIFDDLKVLHVHGLLHTITDCVLPLLIWIVSLVNQEVPAQVSEVTIVPLNTFNWLICVKGDPIDHVRD